MSEVKSIYYYGMESLFCFAEMGMEANQKERWNGKHAASGTRKSLIFNYEGAAGSPNWEKRHSARATQLQLIAGLPAPPAINGIGVVAPLACRGRLAPLVRAPWLFRCGPLPLPFNQFHFIPLIEEKRAALRLRYSPIPLFFSIVFSLFSLVDRLCSSPLLACCRAAAAALNPPTNSTQQQPKKEKTSPRSAS